MAESKSKRKNGKKRAPQRKAPPKAPTKAEIQEAEQEVKKNKKMTYLGLISVAVMLVGILVGQFCGQIGAFVGYPVAFVGSMLGIWTARSQQKGRTMTMVCYTIFAVLVAYSWFFQIINRYLRPVLIIFARNQSVKRSFEFVFQPFAIKFTIRQK